jgi:predicted RNase H-like HicB family nuclease
MLKKKKKIPLETLKLEKEFEVIIELDEDGMYVASIPELKGCHTQAKSMNELRDRISKAAILYLGAMAVSLKVWMEYKGPKS